MLGFVWEFFCGLELLCCVFFVVVFVLGFVVFLEFLECFYCDCEFYGYSFECLCGELECVWVLYLLFVVFVLDGVLLFLLGVLYFLCFLFVVLYNGFLVWILFVVVVFGVLFFLVMVVGFFMFFGLLWSWIILLGGLGPGEVCDYFLF